MISRPVMDERAFHGTLGRITKALDPHTEADPSGVLLSLLSAYSVAVGDSPKARVGNQEHPLLVWGILVGRTNAGRKGTATHEAFGVVKKACPDLLDPAKHFVGSGISSGAALVTEVYGRAWSTGWVSETSEEGEEEPVITINPGFPSLMLIEEWAAVLKRSRMDDSYGQNLRLGWQGSTLSSITKKDVFTVPNPHLGIIGHISPMELKANLSTSDLAGGSGNRFLWFYVEKSKSLPEGGNMSSEEHARLVEDFKSAVEYGHGFKGAVPYSPEARRVWNEEMYSELDEITTSSGEMEEFAGRAIPYVRRLAALYALSDGRGRIALEDLYAARAVVLYGLESVEYIHKADHYGGKETVIDLSPSDGPIRPDIPGRVLRMVRENGGRVPAKQVYQYLNLRAADADLAVSLLEGRVEKVTVPSKPRHRVLYRLTSKGSEMSVEATASASPSPTPKEALKMPTAAPERPQRATRRKVSPKPKASPTKSASPFLI